MVHGGNEIKRTELQAFERRKHSIHRYDLSWVFAEMTPSVGFSDITDGSQSPSCNICVANYHLNIYMI